MKSSRDDPANYLISLSDLSAEGTLTSISILDNRSRSSSSNCFTWSSFLRIRKRRATFSPLTFPFSPVYCSWNSKRSIGWKVNTSLCISAMLLIMRDSAVSRMYYSGSEVTGE